MLIQYVHFMTHEFLLIHNKIYIEEYSIVADLFQSVYGIIYLKRSCSSYNL